MDYDRGDNFPFDFEQNKTQFGLKSKGKLSPRSYPIQFERKWKCSFLSVYWEEVWCIILIIYLIDITDTQTNHRRYCYCKIFLWGKNELFYLMYIELYVYMYVYYIISYWINRKYIYIYMLLHLQFFFGFQNNWK